MFNVSVLDQAHVIFDGVATSVKLPGDQGEFEVLDFHKPIVSFLVRGDIVIDNMGFPISKGIARFGEDVFRNLQKIKTECNPSPRPKPRRGVAVHTS